MSYYTATIRDFLLSHYPNGYGLNQDTIYGEFHHYNKIINQTFSKVFDNMELIVPVTDEFKKEFCKRFYNREIGFEVFSQFFIKLENTINTECSNLFIFMDKIRQLKETDYFNDINIKTQSNYDSDSKALNLQETTPEENLEISYSIDSPEKFIRYADVILENYAKNNGNNVSNTTGYSNKNLFDLMNYFADITPIQEKILQILDRRCFLQIY